MPSKSSNFEISLIEREIIASCFRCVDVVEYAKLAAAVFQHVYMLISPLLNMPSCLPTPWQMRLASPCEPNELYSHEYGDRDQTLPSRGCTNSD